jgi:pyruvate dehydrogenase E1 component beta subunit
MPWTKVYKDSTDFDKAAADMPGIRGMTYRAALLEATSQMMEADPAVFVLGEGVDDASGVFGTTLGLHERFGKGRVIDAPLAENGMTGIAVGAAIAGMRPILVHMRVDFLPLSMDQLVNHAAKLRYMSGGRSGVPLTVRAIIGRGWGSAAQHSQSLQAVFAHVPGLKVVMPATPYDAKGLLRSAVYDGDPVVFIEHRWLYEHMAHVPEDPFRVPIGRGAVRRAGKDATVVAFSYMVHEAMKAANVLKDEGIDCEVIDPRTVKPLDSALILESVRKTGRLVVVDTGWRDFGVAAEVAARAAEEAFSSLKAPIVRVCLPDAPTPASPALEEAYYPGKEAVAAAVRRVLA